MCRSTCGWIGSERVVMRGFRNLLAQLAKGVWMYTQTTQLQVLVEVCLGAYSFIKKEFSTP
jgi:hypothetical protein